MEPSPLVYDTAAAAAVWQRVGPALPAYDAAPCPVGACCPLPRRETDSEAMLGGLIAEGAALYACCRRCAVRAPRQSRQALEQLAREEQRAVRALLAADSWDGVYRALPVEFPAAGRKKGVEDLEAAERVKGLRTRCKKQMDKLFEEHQPKVVVNLAAQAGVRYSITNPDAYVQSNLIGFYNILEACRHHEVEHLVYASSSSVYGSNKKVPYSTDDKVDNPVSLYAATKKSNELMAHAYSKLYNIPSTGLRFFTVYGPAGRPDMAYFGFTNKLVKGDTIKIFNYGNCKRDFTYVDDIVEGIMRVMQHAPEKQNGEDGLPIPPYKVYNIGNSHPENLLEFVSILQEELIRAGVLPEDYDFEAHKELVAMQPGDVPVTYADTTPLEEDFGYKPATPLREGLRAFAEWYKEYYC